MSYNVNNTNVVPVAYGVIFNDGTSSGYNFSNGSWGGGSIIITLNSAPSGYSINQLYPVANIIGSGGQRPYIVLNALPTIGNLSCQYNTYSGLSGGGTYSPVSFSFVIYATLIPL